MSHILSDMITIDFVNEDDVVENRLQLDEDVEFLCLDSTMLGEYVVRVDGKCRLVRQDGFDMIVGEEEEPTVELVAGKLLVVARTGVEVPDWETLYRDF